MQKYIAFNLYQQNELGGHQPMLKEQCGDVYLAEDVDALLAAAASLYGAMKAQALSACYEGENGCPRCNALAEWERVAKDLMVR